MSGPYPLTTLAAQIDANGISAPAFIDIYASLQASFAGIYGSDAYLAPDSQDGQWIFALATAFNDINNLAIAVYNSRSPATAQGAGLSSIVKINGLAREIPTNSTVDQTIVGQAGTTINNGVVADANGVKWSLPTQVIIPPAGTIDVTATCQTVGDVVALPTTLTVIQTPTLGWQSTTNAGSAAPGEPVEVDAVLRIRQAKSTAIASVTPLQGLAGAIYGLSGVSRLAIYENDTSAVDANGLPPNSITAVVRGGDAMVIALTLQGKKTLGGYTNGTTSEVVLDQFGVPHTFRFYRPTDVHIFAHVAITALAGYTTAIGAAVQQSISDYINAIPIGDDVLIRRQDLPAQLFGGSGSETFELTALTIFKTGGSPAAADIVIAFNEEAVCDPSNVTLTVT